MRAFGKLLISLICTALGVAASGQSAPPSAEDACDASKIDALVGTVSLSLGSDTAMKKTMPCLIDLWQRGRKGGGLDAYVSNAFLSVMEENPSIFFMTMRSHPDVFAQWLKEVPDLSFTWSGPPPCELERKRKQLISVLTHTPLHESKASSLKQQVIQKLSGTRCRQIE
jgi:hypothetical protein